MRISRHLAGTTRLAGRTVLRVVPALALLFLLAVGLGPRTGAYRTVTVLTGSMRPTMPPGSLVVLVPIEPARLKVGDVVTFEAPIAGHPVVTHRIVEIAEPGDHPVIRTKGDANEGADPWLARISSSVAWTPTLVVPKVGHAMSVLRSPLLRTGTVYLVPGLLLASVLSSIWSRPAVSRVQEA